MSALSSILTERQKSELQKSILDFLFTNGYTQSFEAFQSESNLKNFEPTESDRHHNLLAKKWTSVIRLQKKIIELEQKNDELQKIIDQGVVRGPAKSLDALPQAPAKFSFSQHRAPITRTCFHPQYNVLATASEDMSIKLWDVETGEFERTLKGHTKSVHDISFDPSGRYLASCSSDLTIRIWDSQNDYKNIRTLYGHDHSVSSVCFLGADKLASASRDKTIKIWEFNTGYCIKTITGHAEWVRYISPSEDLKYLVSASNDQTVRLWDTNTGECKQDLRGHDNVVECAYIVPVASYEYIHKLIKMDNKVKFATEPVNLISTHLILILELMIGHDNWVRGLVFHSSGKFIISVSDDKTMKVALTTFAAFLSVNSDDGFIKPVPLSFYLAPKFNHPGWPYFIHIQSSLQKFL
ncbi:hypothetical protein BB560_002626 [Smittium megazygosporum]|uniref:PAC1-like LisH-like dimerisation domain-containing protein n=1 Tax=Smittium megazygosporum TaxID=133381 RepID=A0A2T9ZEE2_9FUNG|nr:hypothetical protein BB560_002626 [Smittium megazygosporum]